MRADFPAALHWVGIADPANNLFNGFLNLSQRHEDVCPAFFVLNAEPTQTEGMDGLRPDLEAEFFSGLAGQGFPRVGQT